MIIKKRNEIFENKDNINKKTVTEVKVKEEEKVDLFDLDNINFAQRQERRRGDRRRGYRRIDDRVLISRAQEEAGTIKDNAAKEGYKAGLERAQGDIEQVKTAIEDFLKAKQEVFEYIAPDILEISIDIARKIVKHEIEQNPEIVLATILDVLKNISQDEAKITIKVNPEQLALTKDSIPEIIALTGLETKIHVFADESIDLGSCIVLTSNGVVDATINTQLEIIKEAFKGI
jgi:flagellar assembly protein FliH